MSELFPYSGVSLSLPFGSKPCCSCAKALPTRSGVLSLGIRLVETSPDRDDICLAHYLAHQNMLFAPEACIQPCRPPNRGPGSDATIPA